MVRNGRLGSGGLLVALLVGGCAADIGGQSSADKQNVIDNKEDKAEGDVSHADLSVTVNQGDTNLSCPNSSACFNVTSEKNITHIFVQVGFDGCQPADYEITVDGKVVDPSKLHHQGGPCNHGEDLIQRDVWFPLTGNQKTAEVCVNIAGAVPALVSVGAKSAEECLAASVTAQCSNCQAPPDMSMPCPPDP